MKPSHSRRANLTQSSSAPSPAAVAAEFGAAGRARAEAALLQSAKLLTAGGGLDGFFSDDEDKMSDDGSNDTSSAAVPITPAQASFKHDGGSTTDKIRNPRVGSEVHVKVESARIKLEGGGYNTGAPTLGGAAEGGGISSNHSAESQSSLHVGDEAESNKLPLPSGFSCAADASAMGVDEIGKLIASWDLFGAAVPHREATGQLATAASGGTGADEELGELAVCFRSPGGSITYTLFAIDFIPGYNICALDIPVSL